MSVNQLILQKAQEKFLQTVGSRSKEGEYEPVLSPLTMDFTTNDFLFLDSNTAAETDTVHRYLDELLEFSLISNSIPVTDKWRLSADASELLFGKFENILQNALFADMDEVSAENLMGSPIFERALSVITHSDIKHYRKRYKKWVEASASDRPEILDDWNTIPSKSEIDDIILKTLRSEAKRFIKRFSELKSKFDALVRNHPGSGFDFLLTSCSPNNLYHAEKLRWSKISINREELKQLKFDEGDDQSDWKKIEFEILFVDVLRAWFDEDILTSPFWNIHLLDPSESKIPRYTTHLIFVRNVDVQTQTSSKSKASAGKSDSKSTVGPFKLKSFQSFHKISSRKQHFQGLLKKAKPQKKGWLSKMSKKTGGSKKSSKPTIKPFIVKPQMLVANVKLPKPIHLSLQFKDEKTGTLLTPSKLKVDARQGKQSLAKSMTIDDNNQVIKIRTFLRTPLMLNIECEGYKSLETSIDVKSLKDGDKVINQVFEMEKIDPGLFQFLGVITKKLPEFPQPIPTINYI